MKAADFVTLVRLTMLSRSNADAVRLADERGFGQSRAATVLKAAQTAGQISNPTSGGYLAEARAIAEGFIESLRQVSVFDRLLAAGMKKMPLRTRTAAISTAATGSVIDEGTPKPVTRLSLAGSVLAARKAIAVIAVSKELAENWTPESDTFLENELKTAVGAASDLSFLGGVLDGVTPMASSGSSAANARNDVERLLEAVDPKATSKLFLVMTPDIAISLSTKGDSAGAAAFPGMTPQGGELCGMPALVTDGLTIDTSGGQMMLIDATAIAAGSETIGLSRSEQATIEVDDAPAGGAGAVMVSLWQENLVAIRAERYFGAELVRANGVALITGITY